MCRKFEEYTSKMESTFLTLRQQADINTAAMVARGVDTTESTDSATNHETFTETPENSEDTDMIVDDPVDPKTKENSPILI